MKALLSRMRPRSGKRFLVVTATTIALSMTVTLFSSGQSPNPAGVNSEKHGIAVVDVSYIFKEHKRFRGTMDDMKKEMAGIEAELKADREKIAATEQERNRFGVGSAEYKKLDEQVAEMMAQFNLKMTRLRKDFLERDAKV